MVTFYCIALAIFIVLERLLELRIAVRNRAKMLAMGAQEFGRSHYPLFFVLHAGWLLGWIYEAMLNATLNNYWYVWISLFFLAEALRYWCITSLGHFWNTRILVVPGAKIVCRGPYKFISHPNYLAVSLELFSVPLIFGDWTTALAAVCLNAVLLLGIRIPEEEQALKLLKQS